MSGGPEGKTTSTGLTGFTGLKNISFEESRLQCPLDLDRAISNSSRQGRVLHPVPFSFFSR
jgi:hypothetical protein